MKILVTGGAGYVGSDLVPTLLQEGHTVRVLDSLLFGGRGILTCFRYPKFHFVKGDIRNKALVKECIRDVDVIIHLAAIVGYPACKKDTRLAKEINVNGSKVINAARSKAQRLIFASTGSNYGAIVGDLCEEDTPLNPLTDYGKTKTEGEKIFLDSGNVVVYRFATAFGLANRLRLDLMINDFVYRAVKERNLIIYEKHFKRTFIHVRDMSRSFQFAIKHFARMKDQVFNVGSEKMNYSKEEIARVIQKKIRYYLHFAEVGKDEDQRNYEVSYKKINSLGYETSVSIERGIEELISAMQVIDVRNEFSNV
jgi:nucleoside-diphosphate-sugar epimerase